MTDQPDRRLGAYGHLTRVLTAYIAVAGAHRIIASRDTSYGRRASHQPLGGGTAGRIHPGDIVRNDSRQHAKPHDEERLFVGCVLFIPAAKGDRATEHPEKLGGYEAKLIDTLASGAE